ncbi:MAG TPA: DUF4062 domain-containing protein [Thermoanaerobaculia bacterium]|nr:DUF4062 domain-containing protein [Thermoanaerobaculia bacterium]
MGETLETVRFFVSSTFRDLYAEREELVQRVFPRLRKLCAERGVTWSEVDLRWGITEEQSERGEVLPICLAEIDRCRPFFLCMLGERYGWVAGTETLAEVAARHPWVASHPGASVTELEILHGALNEGGIRPAAFFYFRDPAHAADDIDDVDEHCTRMLALKERIRRSGLPLYDGYRSPADLGARVLADLTALIDRLHPAGSSADPLDRETAEHAAFARSRIGSYVGRQESFRMLDDFAASATRDDGPGLAIIGAPGSGKSALLANWLVRHRAAHPGDITIHHALGATPSSTNGEALLRRLLGELARRLDIDITIPNESAALRSAFVAALPKIGRKVVLILDGLDLLEDRDGYPTLSWLPDVLPAHLRVIVAALPGRAQEVLAQRPWPTLTVEPLNAAERRAVITDFLRQAGKSLSEEQVMRIVAAQPAANPLFLTAMLEELRVFGVHERLDERLAFYLAPQDAAGAAPTLEDLFDRILQRYESAYERERPGLVRDAMSLLWASRRGLAEHELLMLLGPAKDVPLPHAYWAPLFFAAGHALMDRGGQITFFHDAMRNAVRNRYLTTETAGVHLRLADYFATRQGIVGVTMVEPEKGRPPQVSRIILRTDARVIEDRQLEELPWQLAQAKEWQRLALTLADLGFLNDAWKANPADVEAFWGQLYAESPWRAPDAYEEVIDDPVEYRNHLDAVTQLLRFLGHLDAVADIDRRMIEDAHKSGDEKQLARHLQSLAILLRKMNRLDEALALHREEEEICRRLDKTGLLAACLMAEAHIHRRRGELEQAKDLMQEAEPIVRELDQPGLLASLLNNRALLLKALGASSDEVAACYREVETLARQANDGWMLAHTLTSLSGLALQPLTGKERWTMDDLEHLFRHLYPPLEEAYQLARMGRIAGLVEKLRSDYENFRKTLRDYARMLTRNGVGAFRRGDLDESVTFYGRAEEVYRRLHDDEGVSICLGERALVLMEHGQSEAALELMREEEQICRRLKDLDGLETCLGNQTMILLLRDEVDAAEAMLRKREEECGALTDPAAQARRLGHRSQIHAKRGELEDALCAALEQEQLARKAEDFEGICTGLQQRAELLAELGRREEAVAAAEKCLRMAKDHGLDALAREVEVFLAALSAE